MASEAPVISVTNLSKRFGDREILRGLNFEVHKGETLVVLGRSGTGKSVLLKILIGLLEPTTGAALVMGKAIHRLPEQERLRERRKIGYVFQGGALFDSLSVRDNVGFPLYQNRVPDDEITERVRQRLEMVGLAHTLEQLPTELSGGMQKRVSLARAIIELPDIVLYDEPTSGLDPLTTDVINQIILRLRSGLNVTSVVVTHDMKSAFTIADRIIMLDQGRIVAEGTPEEIQASDSPWVQHFIHGEALDNEAIASGVFAPSSARFSRVGQSARRVSLRQSSDVIPGIDTSAMTKRPQPPPIRQRRRSGRRQAVRDSDPSGNPKPDDSEDSSDESQG